MAKEIKTFIFDIRPVLVFKKDEDLVQKIPIIDLRRCQKKVNENELESKARVEHKECNFLKNNQEQELEVRRVSLGKVDWSPSVVFPKINLLNSLVRQIEYKTKIKSILRQVLYCPVFLIKQIGKASPQLFFLIGKLSVGLVSKLAGLIKTALFLFYLLFKKIIQLILGILGALSWFADHFFNFILSKIKKTCGGIIPTRMPVLENKINFLISESTDFKRSLAVFVLICLFFPLSIKGLAFFHNSFLIAKEGMLDDANIAYQYMQSAQQSVFEQEFDLAAYKFGVAAQGFITAQRRVEKAGNVLAQILKIIPPKNKIASGEYLLEAGANLALAGQYIAKAIEPFSEVENIFSAIQEEQKSDQSQKGLDFTSALALASQNLNTALDKIRKARVNLEKVDRDDLPDNFKEQVISIQKEIPNLEQGLSGIAKYSNGILEILGHRIQKRYLLLFENNRELRATGGFIGTYGLLDLEGGKIKKLFIEGPYNIDGQLKEKIISPEPLHLINPHWYMRDANWFADFPTSAQKVAWFYEKAGGPTVDGVIVITANVLQKLLEVTGPIEMPEYDTEITADNFYEATQYEVEIDYDKKKNEPKKFIVDLMPKILDRVLNLKREKWLEVANIFTKMLDEKEIMIYFSDLDLEKLILDFNWGGELKETKKDYINVVASNVGGGKTDGAISTEIHHQAEIKDDGSIIDTLIITRTHNGSFDDMWNNVKNVIYFKIYTPKGSKLIKAAGFDSEFNNMLISPDKDAKEDPLLSEINSFFSVHKESQTKIFNESEKTVFGNWQGLEVGQRKTVTLQYELPFKVDLDSNNPESYSLLIQKQAGANDFNFSSRFVYPDRWQPVWHYTSDGFLASSPGKVSWNTLLNKDKTYAVVFSK